MKRAGAALGLVLGASFFACHDDGVDFVGRHPQAADQPTALGRTLATLVAWNGSLYAGFGDANANTGPIAISPCDPRTGTFRLAWVSDTEAILTFRTIGPLLFAPAVDRRERADYAVGEPWRDEGSIGTFHAFDMATLTGADLWLVGAHGRDAVAWHSLDGGRTWSESLRIPPPDASGASRFFFAGVYRGSLYVQASRSVSNVFEGTSWSDGPDLLPEDGDVGWHPLVFAGRMVYLGAPGAGASGSRLLAFDGTRVDAPFADAVHDFTAAAGRLFALGADGVVWRTADLLRWTSLGTAPAGSRSIAVLDDEVYLGTTEAEIYRLRRHAF